MLRHLFLSVLRVASCGGIPFYIGLRSVPVSFATKVPLATWSPFGLSLAYFGALSCSNVWFFPVVVTFQSCGLHPSSVSSLIAFRGCGLRSLQCSSIYGCFVCVLCLLSSVRHSLFLSWPFFICATPSSVFGCLWVLFLGSVTRSDLRFPLATGSPVGTSPLCFSWPPSSSPPVVSSVFVVCSLGFILFCIWSSLSSFVFCLCLFCSLYWGVSFPPPFCVFLFILPSWILCCFSLNCLLPFFSLSPWGSLRFPSLVSGFSLPGLSPSLLSLSAHGPSGFPSSGLSSDHFLCALLISCAYSPSC